MSLWLYWLVFFFFPLHCNYQEEEKWHELYIRRKKERKVINITTSWKHTTKSFGTNPHIREENPSENSEIRAAKQEEKNMETHFQAIYAVSRRQLSRAEFNINSSQTLEIICNFTAKKNHFLKNAFFLRNVLSLMQHSYKRGKFAFCLCLFLALPKLSGSRDLTAKDGRDIITLW